MSTNRMPMTAMKLWAATYSRLSTARTSLRPMPSMP